MPLQSFSNMSKIVNFYASVYAGCVCLMEIRYTTLSQTIIPTGAMPIVSNTYDGVGRIAVGNTTSIPDNFLRSNRDIKSMEIITKITSIGEFAFSGTSNLEYFKFGPVEEIKESAFSSSALKKVETEKLKTIGINAFQYSEIQEAILGGTLTEIPRGVFDSTYNLKHVVLPETLQIIRSGAFAYLDELLDITCYAKVPPTVERSAFIGVVEGFNIFVPAESVDAYKAATGWSNFEYYIKPLNY